ncbi:hypothetical protein FI667_g4058, partial [Globisporangium splendens]
MKTVATALIVATSLAAMAPSADAHGYISFPKAQYKDPAKATDYNAIITASINKAFAGKKWNDNPTANANTFTAAFKKSGYTSLRQMLDKKVPGCQNSRTDITPVNVKGATSMKWQNDWEHKGFIDSHHVLCAVIGSLRDLVEQHARAAQRRLRGRVHDVPGRVASQLLGVQGQLHPDVLLAGTARAKLANLQADLKALDTSEERGR